MHLESRSLIKKFGSRTVVDRISVRIDKGEIVGLLGPNGAGKTTTFYMIVGLEKPTHGDVYLSDICITDYPMYRRAELGISYLTQEPSIFRKLTVTENIAAILETTKLSGGERRRVEIARCLALEPQFILLDEPFAGVDPLAVADIQEIIEYLRQRGMGILITDHNVRETLHIVDRVYLLSEGKLLLEGDSKTIAESPIARKFYLGENFSL